MESCSRPHSENGLPEPVLQKIHAVLVRYPQLEKAVLYDSRTKGTHKNGSDINLILRGGTDLTLNVRCKIANDLDALFLTYTIDLSIFHNISDPDMIGHIQRVGVTIYKNIRRIMLRNGATETESFLKSLVSLRALHFFFI